LQDLTDQRENVLKLNEELQAKLSGAVSDLTNTTNLLNSTRSQLQSSDETNSGLVEKMKALEESHTFARSEWDQLLNSVVDQKTVADSLLQQALADLDRIRNELSSMEIAKNELSSENCRLESQLAKLSAESEMLNTQKEEVQSRLVGVSMERDSVQAKFEEAEQKMSSLQCEFSDTVKTLQNTADSLTTDRATFKSKLDSASEEIEHLCRQRDDLSRELGELTQQKHQLQELYESQLSKSEEDKNAVSNVIVRCLTCIVHATFCSLGFGITELKVVYITNFNN